MIIYTLLQNKCTFQILGDVGVGGRDGRVTTVSNSLMLGGWEGDNSIQFINVGRVGDKRFKEWRRKIGGRVGDNNNLTFLCYSLDKKMPL